MKKEIFSVKTKGLLKNTKISMARLYMFLLTDGGVSIGNGKYEIYFVNSSDILLNYFSDTVKKLSDAKIHTFILSSGQKIFRIYDKELSQKLLRISNTLRTKPCERYPKCPKLLGKSNSPCRICKQISFGNVKYPFVRIPRFIFNLKPTEIADLLRIATSAEGYVTLYFRKNLKIERELGFSCNHSLLKKGFKKLFEIAGVKFNEREKRLFISNKKEIQNFKKSVGFVTGSLVSKHNSFWFGTPKNVVLDVALKSYNFPRSFWKSFSSKTPALEYLKNLSHIH